MTITTFFVLVGAIALGYTLGTIITAFATAGAQYYYYRKNAPKIQQAREAAEAEIRALLRGFENEAEPEIDDLPPNRIN